MLKILISTAVIAGTIPAGATPVSHDTPQAEALGAACEAGDSVACRQLVTLTGGNCAAPAGSGCRYGLDLSPVRHTVINPGEPMVLVPGLESQGYSRISTVEHCQELTGAADWSQLTTDWEFESMEACLTEHT